MPPLSDAHTQLSLLKKHADTLLASLFETPDLLILNQSQEDESVFEPLKIEVTRSLHTEVLKQPLGHEVRAIIIGDLDRASLPAQHALLKLLEEPPAHIQFLLTTSQPSYILETIHSRCKIVTIHQEQGTPEEHVLEPVLADVLNTPESHLSLSEIFTLSDTYKDRSKALRFTQTLLQAIHTHARYPAPDLLRVSQAALTTLQRVQLNGNTRLVIEELLFTFSQER